MHPTAHTVIIDPPENPQWKKGSWPGPGSTHVTTTFSYMIGMYLTDGYGVGFELYYSCSKLGKCNHNRINFDLKSEIDPFVPLQSDDGAGNEHLSDNLCSCFTI